MMRKLNLASDEGIICQTKNVERYQENDKYTEVYEMYLTNKNLILIYEKSINLFKSEDVTEKIPLEDIRVIKNKVQVFKTEDDDYGWGMQIIFKDGSMCHFVFEKEQEIKEWVNAIKEILVENREEVKNADYDVKIDEYEKNETKLESPKTFLNGLMGAVDSAKETIKSIKNQINSESENKVEPQLNDKNLDNDIYCSNCGEKIDSKSKYCNSCGVLVNSDNNDNEIEDVSEDNFSRKNVDDLSKRNTVYDGKIHKCPNCGEVLKSFITICPACGFELSRKEINESLKNFIEKINKCEEEIESNNKSGWSSWSKAKKFWWVVLNLCFLGIPLVIYFVLPLALINKTPKLSKEEKQMANLIENFPFPNDRESILAALVFAKEKVNFLANANVDRKSAYWLRLWNTKAEQLKQKADMLLLNDQIVKKSYDDIVNANNKVNKIITIKAVVGIVILVFAIIFLVIRSYGDEFIDLTDYNATFEWQTNGLFAKLPEPETNNGKITGETDERIQFELYNVSSEEFDKYTKRCRENGFTFDITKYDDIFYAKDKKGYDLDIHYYKDKKVMEISLNSYYLNDK